MDTSATHCTRCHPSRPTDLDFLIYEAKRAARKAKAKRMPRVYVSEDVGPSERRTKRKLEIVPFVEPKYILLSEDAPDPVYSPLSDDEDETDDTSSEYTPSSEE